MATLTLSVGYDLIYECPQPTPMMLMLHIHHVRAADIIEADLMYADPHIPTVPYRDGFGNWCTRILAPTGRLRLSARALLRDSGEPDPIAVASNQHPVEELPEDVVVYLLGSRYCETDRLTEAAWDLFSRAPSGAARVQAICDFVHHHITFNYQDARSTRTAWDALQERKGVCRDYAHLAVALCRCMNIPARYCTGYLTDIGVEPPYGPMDFAAWFEAYIGGRWHTFDARNNTPRIGRILIGQGRDAADVPIAHTFGPNKLVSFRVWTDEVK